MRRERNVSFIRTWNLGFLTISHEHKSATNLRSKCWNYAQIWNVYFLSTLIPITVSVKPFNVLTTAPFTRKSPVKEISNPFTSNRGWHSWASTTGLTRIPAPLWKLPAAKPLDITRVSSPAWDVDRAVDKQDFLMEGKGHFFLVVIESHFGSNETKCKCFCFSREPEFPWALQLLGERDFSISHCWCRQGNRCSSFELCFGFVEDLIKHNTFWIREFCPKEWAFQDETLFCQTFP